MKKYFFWNEIFFDPKKNEAMEGKMITNIRNVFDQQQQQQQKEIIINQ